MSEFLTSTQLLLFCEQQKQINILPNKDEVLIPGSDYLIGSTMLNYDSIDAPEFIPSSNIDASEFIPYKKPNSLEFVLANKIDMNPPIPINNKSKCHKDRDCTKSNCKYNHDISWYKREYHFIRIYNEHQKEIKSIIDFKIPMFPKLLPHYEQIINYHDELSSLAYKYAEIYKNDMSYLVDYNKPREKQYINKTWNKLGEKYRE